MNPLALGQLLYEMAFWAMMCVAADNPSGYGRHFPPLREIRGMPDSMNYDWEGHTWQKRGNVIMWHNAEECYHEDHINPYPKPEIKEVKDTVIEHNGIKINNGLNFY